ncbi:uncharacterized protein CEXT_467611 [Caerostris extrusa]|uniref:PiggyBac transposable element-derived protein 4 C-terminal zinc-finger domain-containing protein n=1 Tax=Caerostris extrusa TaxID=172846 RepID=A0AAV4WUB3_CAEEX|nr:uncharacterized protein CEXT_467611 [Caerostris extrusa]
MFESDLDDYFPSSSGSETSEYDITSDEEDSDCDYSLKDARRWTNISISILVKRNYITIFRHLLDMAIWNASILWKRQLPNIDNYDFRMDLVERIIENFHVTAPRYAKRQKLQSDCPLRFTTRHFPDLVPSTSSKKNASRKCIVCSKTKIRRETRYQCNECDVGLCVQSCFRKYTADKF